MVGRKSLAAILVASLLVGCFTGVLYYRLNTHETAYDATRWGYFDHDPHQFMGGLTNVGDEPARFEFRVEDTNASIYVMSPEQFNLTRDGNLTYDSSLSLTNITNTTVILYLQSNYTLELYSGDDAGVIIEVGRRIENPSWWESSIVGFVAFAVCLTSLIAYQKRSKNR